MYACSHGVVFAQLIVDGTSCGVFGFFMQFRDEKGMLMPGVEVGEIGPKVGPTETNIGYARFDNVRVPHFNMFAKHAKVTLEGQFIPAPPKLNKFKYVGMMNVRAMLVGGASHAAAKAATIAIRYSTIRRQGFKDSKAADALTVGENVILDYKFQQYRVFKALGLGYLFLWSGRSIRDYLKRVVDAISNGDDAAAEEMPDLHATCGGLKAICTTMASEAIEDARKSCGGQGFMRSSGIADLSGNYVGTVTAEGEAVILALQTARFLIKSVDAIKKGKRVTGSVTYLGEEPLGPVNLPSYANQRGTIVALLEERARRAAFELQEDFSKAIDHGKSFDEALNSVMVLAWSAAEYHCMYYLAKEATESTPRYVEDPAALAAVTRVIDLVLLQHLREKPADLFGVLDVRQTRLMLAEINRLLDAIRPDAVALSDAFGFTDHALKSTLGRYDGNVYEAIYEEAKVSPLNNTGKMVGWDQLSQVLDMEFIKQNKSKQRHGVPNSHPRL